MTETRIKNLEIDNEAYRRRIGELEAQIKELKKDSGLQKQIKDLAKSLECRSENIKLKKQLTDLKEKIVSKVKEKK